MTGDMPRPSTRLSSREPTRKRRRAPPPLSVTNVFADSRLPDTSEKLWKWPVTSWYFGDVGNADLHITTDRPFVKSASSLPPLEKHYRLRWLEEDATRFVDGQQPQPPEPLPSIPYARQKDTTACARPSKGLGTAVERNAPGRPRKRQCVPKEAPVIEAATIGPRDIDEVAQCRRVANLRPPQSLQNARVVPPTAMKVEPSTIVAKSEPLLVNVKPQHVLQRESKIPPASNFCTPPLSAPSLSIPSPSETIACETPSEDASAPSPIPQEKEDAKESIHSDGKNIQDDDEKSEDDKSDADSREEVLLQFVSPVESRLMGTLTYTLPINAAPKKEEKDALVDDPSPEVKHTTFDEEGVCVEDMDLEFRKSTRPFEDTFDDIDTSDELRPEIMRLNTLLNGLGPKTKPLRNMTHAVVQSEIQRQKGRAETEAEEMRIIARLKEIEKEKAAAKAAEKAAEKAALAKDRAAARHSSGRAVAQGRRRRPSRRIQEEPDSDDDNDRGAEYENGDDGDLKMVSEPMVVDKPAPVMENKVVDNRKLLLKPAYKAELEELTAVILNGPQAAPAVGRTPEAEITVQPTPGEDSAPRSDEDIRHVENHESVESGAEKRPETLAEADSSVKPTFKIDYPTTKGAVTPVIENKEPEPIEYVIVKAPAPASAVIVSPDCVTQLGLDQIRNESLKSDLSPLKLTGAQVENSNTSKERVRAAFAELTNVPSISPPEDPAKPQLTDAPSAGAQEPESSPACEGPEHMSDGPQKQLTPLEPEAEVTTTPITEIDMDATPDSDDESKPKETAENDEADQEAEEPTHSGKPSDFDSDSQPMLTSKEEEPPGAVFLQHGKDDEQLVRMPSPVSPIQAATPTCGFVVVPTTGPTKVLTSGSALVNHMKAMHAVSTKKDSLQNGS